MVQMSLSNFSVISAIISSSYQPLPATTSNKSKIVSSHVIQRFHRRGSD